MARIDRLKRSVGTAVQRSSPSRAARLLVERGLAHGRVLDYGCGFGLDAETFGWEAYDPVSHPREPIGPYDTIVCTLVLNVLSRNNRAKVVQRIQELLAPDGRAYLGVARNLPETGKLGVRHCIQNSVVLSLPIVHQDAELAIYELRTHDTVVDRTRDFLSRRDARHLA
jgi:SAM-dependent methyltransferase